MTALTKASIIIFITAFLAQIIVSNHMSIKTQELNSLQGQIAQVHNQISAVNQEIYLASSISGMEGRAKSAGFSRLSGNVKTLSNPTIARAF